MYRIVIYSFEIWKYTNFCQKSINWAHTQISKSTFLVNCILSLTNFTNNELQNSCGFEQGKDCYIFLPCIHLDNSNSTNWYKHMSCKLATRTTAGYTTSKVPAECYIKICVEQVLHSVPRINNYTLMNKGAARPYAWDLPKSMPYAWILRVQY